MPTVLKIKLLSKAPEVFVAVECKAEVYLTFEQAEKSPYLTWRSAPLDRDAIDSLLSSRGWHQTDRGDAFHEARASA